MNKCERKNNKLLTYLTQTDYSQETVHQLTDVMTVIM